MTSSLLPNGLRDLLPPFAAQERDCISTLLAAFAKFGYQQVKPPLIEFEDTLLSGPGKALARQTFRLMDPVSQNMMGVRADVTAQIARIAGSRLQETPRPLRLSYAADVLRVNGTQLRPERQFCQVGCELIGADDLHDDVEAALVAIQSLYACGLSGLSIDLSVPTLTDLLLSVSDFEEEQKQAIKALLKKRDHDGLKSRPEPVCKIFSQLQYYSGPATDALAVLSQMDLPDAARSLCHSVQATVEALQQALDIYAVPCRITIDWIEQTGFPYQTGVSFTLFSPIVRGELGRGGRYQINDGGQEQACGFTLYMDSILQAIRRDKADDSQPVKQVSDWTEIKSLQDQGHCVIRTK